ncbi:DUF58 domain-containing protein [Stieleria sp. TO1_6]|uniref:DUF58 domain-containing protein n=1 Tax=Stieleria tagensis TaxID=2956795 RepID=UPI00209AF4E9|nr:DUF58 domain-containing protein [Stieleria tagensis]MCO8123257.1 DUF58 domain-containing protein [Stieleria tagensis]
MSSQKSETSHYLDTASMLGLETMRFSTKRRIEGTFSGRHVARRQGGAGQYIDSREYSPGDDLRRLDWPAMGRTGRAYVRLYQDETNLSCLLTIDASGSMYFGARSKFDDRGSKLEWTKYFATAMTHLIALGRDQVGMSVAAEHGLQFIAPAAAPRQIRILQHEIAGLVASGRTQLGESLDDSFLRMRRRGVMMVISDFLVQPLDDVLRGMRKFRARGWETIAVHLVHPDEEVLPKGVAFRFSGMEGEPNVDCRPGDIRNVYQQRFSQHCAHVRDGLLGAGCDYRRFSTATPYLDAVRQFLVPRRG